jgi:cation transport ATPase
MEDQSIFNHTSDAVNQDGINEYANELIKEVCLNGDMFSKYQKVIEKRFGVEFYKKCNDFVKEVKRLVDNKKFSNTSIINLKYLAKEINISTDTVELLADHFNQQFEKEQRLAEEERRRREEEERRKKEEEERRKREEEEKAAYDKMKATQLIKDIKKRRSLSIAFYLSSFIILLICIFSFSCWSLIYGCLASLASLMAFSISEAGIDKIFTTLKGINTLMIVTGIYVVLVLVFLSPWWLGLLVTIGGAGIVLLTIMILDGAFD